ncbi:hypothetical protein E6O75_ATG06544 [Venturia nashicola]|uniref:Uncharacterized protein n=1 Tax=Venturia nashicola TaxID=86259 RepID=A0A4Z1PBV6_9PEZI|nr:hypothetical protein E6O75_ATG06544 [Venturia nashicola]
MSPSGKAPMEGSGGSSEKPLGDDQDARPSPASTSLRELFQRTKPKSALTDPFKDDLNDLNTDYFIVPKPSVSPAVSPSNEVTALSALLALSETSSPSHSTPRTSSPSPSPSQSTEQRPSFRTRIARNRRDRANSRPKSSRPQGIPPKSTNSSPVAATPASPEKVTKEKEQDNPPKSSHSPPAQQTLDKAAAKSWKEKFLATEAKEKLPAKAYEPPSKDKDQALPGIRPRSKSIRLGLGRNNSDSDEPQDWEKDFANFAGTRFEEPKEWLLARGINPDGPPPPSPRPRALDGENENGEWGTAAIIASMNNSYNFDPNMNPNAARQAPNAAQAQQMNGMNGGQHWPNVGAQADMNVLWEYIQNLSQMHEGIRAQTQHVLNGVQQIQARGADDGGPPHVNGISNGASQSQVAEIARLQNDLSSSNNKIDDLNSYVCKLQGLNQDYEAALSHLMDKVRPFAQQHAQALLSQKAHYLRLIEEERNQNLELRLEQTRFQESASRINENLKEAMKALMEAELPYIRKIAALKADNKALRRICGVPLMDDSDDDDEEAEVVETKENVNGVVVQHESPVQMEHVGRDKILASLGQ